ncbi:hypothetical protein [Mailhella sp.]|uniref:hypothetical protein n=1 Tax=Mailhella sp. TaxID=1981029 RepID=UPI004064B28F
MKYIYAVGNTRRGRQSKFLLSMYQELCERYGEVAVYHRNTAEPAQFSRDTTVISACPDTLRALSAIPGLNVVSYEELTGIKISPSV